MMEFPEGIREGDQRPPLGLKIVYVAVTAWCLWYLAVSLKQHGVAAVTPLETQTSVR